MGERTRSLGHLIGGLLVLVAPAFPAKATAQAVGFQPVPAPLPSGVSLNVTPAVTADRRYVRMGVNAGFSDIRGFSTFSVPAAVGGGAAGMNGPIAGQAGGGAGGAGGAPGLGGLIGGLGAAGGGSGGAIGMSGFPYAWAVSGGYGPLNSYGPLNGYGPMNGWDSAGWSAGPGLGVGAQAGFGNGMNGANGAMIPGLTVPGVGQPLTTSDFPTPGVGGNSSDPFEQARNGQALGAGQGQGFNPQEAIAPRRRSRTRARAPRRTTVAPRRTPAANARQGAPIAPPVVREAIPDADPEQPR